MRVLLGLGDVELRAALARDDRPDRDRRPLRREGDRERPVLVVLGQRRVAVDDLGELRRDLAHPVGPEVEREHGVARPDPRLLPDRRRGDELVGLVALVGGLDRLPRRCRRGARRGPLAQQVDGLLGPVPALVAVHREVAADHRADPAGALLAAGLLDRRDRRGAGGRRRVAAVGEGMDHEVGHVELGREPDQRLQVLLGGVHAAARDEPDQVDALGGAEGGAQRLVLGQRAVLDRGVDPREVLRHDRAGAEVEVADLGVAHLPGREPDGLALRGQRGVRVLAPRARRTPACRPARPRCPGRRARAPSRRARRGRRRGRVTPRRPPRSPRSRPGSRLAPPTSAPSTSGSASSSAALSGLHEPP